MRRQLIVTTSLIALAAMLVLGHPAGRRRERAGAQRRARPGSSARPTASRPRSTIAPRSIAASMRVRSPACSVPGMRLSCGCPGGRCGSGGCRPARGWPSAPGASQGVRVTVFASAAEVARRERQVWLLIAGLALAGTAAAAGLAVLQARRFIRPLQRLAVTSARLGDGDFSARTGRLALPEFDRVAAALDAAAAQIAQLVGRQREFTANVSHQLRTPLTAMRLRLDELATLEDPEAAREELEATLRVADRLERTVGGPAGAGPRGRPRATPRDVDLASWRVEHAAGWRPVFARAGRSLRSSVERPCRRGSARAAWHRRSTCCWRTRSSTAPARPGWKRGVQGGRYRIAVTDDGPGVPPALEARIFERDVSTAGSTGIGLSLARALVEADGGRLVLAQPRPARFEILIPQPRPGRRRRRPPIRIATARARAAGRASGRRRPRGGRARAARPRRARRRGSGSPSRRGGCARAAARRTGRAPSHAIGFTRSRVGLMRRPSPAAAGREQPSHGPWRAWSSTSAANASSALRTSRTAPSGWRQAPRPVTSPRRRLERARSARPRPARAGAAARRRPPAIAGSPCTHGPHWPADSAASQRDQRARLGDGAARRAGRATTTPAPSAAPCAAQRARRRAGGRAPRRAGSQAPK